MLRPLSLLLLLAGLTACATDPALLTDPAPAPAPNVLLIVADDLGWADLNCYGNPLIESPHLDALARNGVQFMQAYATAPTDVPSRASLQSGLYPARMPAGLEARHRTLGEVAAAAGHYTAHLGQWDCGPRSTEPGNQGYVASFTDSTSADRLTDRALALLNQLRDTSWFLSINYFEAARPLAPPADWLEHYQQLVRRTHSRPYPALPYAATVSALDEQIGRLLDWLGRDGRAERTLVIFLSDNGGVDSPETTDNGILRGGKGELYEGGIRIPLIVSYPAASTLRRALPVPVIATDVFATVAAVMGEPDATPDGQSLLPLLRGERADRRDLFWHQADGEHPGAVIRREQWKMIYDARADSVVYHDLSRFPDERHGTANAPEEDLAGALRKWKAGLGISETRSRSGG